LSASFFIIVLDDRARQPRAFLDAQTGGDAAGGDVADDHLERNDLDLADQLFAHVQAADEMGWDADLGEPLHQVLADPVVQHAFAGDDAFLGAVAGGRVVLEILHQGAGLRSFEQDFGFALIELAASCHYGILAEPLGRRLRGGCMTL
jgi:hypothetical protein